MHGVKLSYFGKIAIKRNRIFIEKNRGVQGVVFPPLGALKTKELKFKLEY